MIALVTGASSGIGEATARRLARDPATHVVLLARREEKLQALAAELGSAAVLAADLTSVDTPERVHTFLADQYGCLDLLVNNAGAGWPGTFAESGSAGIRKHMELNFDAQVRLTEALLPLLRASAPSMIINVASVAGRVSRPGSAGYSASKAALISWSDTLHLEEAAHGVRVGHVLPGFIATEGIPQAELRRHATTRWLVSTPEKVAETIADVAVRGKTERYVPRPYGLLAGIRILAVPAARWGARALAP